VRKLKYKKQEEEKWRNIYNDNIIIWNCKLPDNIRSGNMAILQREEQHAVTWYTHARIGGKVIMKKISERERMMLGVKRVDVTENVSINLDAFSGLNYFYIFLIIGVIAIIAVVGIIILNQLCLI
jgi:hypothetical protein